MDINEVIEAVKLLIDNQEELLKRIETLEKAVG